MHVALVGAELEENLAVRYLRGSLEAEGHPVTQIDFDRPGDLERAAAALAASQAPLAGLSMVFTRRAREFSRLAARARELGYRGRIVAGGHFAAFHAEELLRDVPAIDLVALGEGERILCALAGGGAPEQVPNLVWREGGGVRRSPQLPPEQDLDALPWPTHKRPFDSYLGLPIANLVGSRGCTHACAFCSIAAWHGVNGGARWRCRSAGDIAAEMASLYRDGVRLFNFHDDNFLGRDRDANLARVRALDEAWAREGLGKIGFQIKARPDSVDEELFGELRAMGLYRVFLGIEAGTETSLVQLGRGQRLHDNVRALDLLADLEVHVAFNLLLLNPDSTLDDLAANVAFLRAHPQQPMNFCRTEIYEGTPLARRLRRQGRLRGDYWGLDYVIADPGAQRAFELMRATFHDRNFGDQPLHYLGGQVDYEQQLRADFFGTNARLRAAAKAFVRRVNESTVGLLEELVEAARRGVEPQAFAAEVSGRMAAEDRRLGADGLALLQQIRAVPERVRASRSRVPRAVVAAASLAAACGVIGTHSSEMAAQWTDAGAGPGKPDASVDAGLRDGGGPDASTDAGPVDAGDGGADDYSRERLNAEPAEMHRLQRPQRTSSVFSAPSPSLRALR